MLHLLYVGVAGDSASRMVNMKVRHIRGIIYYRLIIHGWITQRLPSQASLNVSCLSGVIIFMGFPLGANVLLRAREICIWKCTISVPVPDEWLIILLFIHISNVHEINRVSFYRKFLTTLMVAFPAKYYSKSYISFFQQLIPTINNYFY